MFQLSKQQNFTFKLIKHKKFWIKDQSCFFGNSNLILFNILAACMLKIIFP